VIDLELGGQGKSAFWPLHPAADINRDAHSRIEEGIRWDERSG
jgi:hypothetical protein